MPIQAPQWTDYLNCPVCCREFGPPPRSPISLGCGHTLCRKCLKNLHKKQCPFDQTVIQVDLEDLVENTALLQLAGFSSPEQPFHPPCIKALPEHERRAYDVVVKCLERLAVFLKFSSNANNNTSGRLSRPMQRKLVTLLQCSLTDEEGRGKAARAARSLGERTVTELILQHQNPQQLSANLWAAVRSRGCQFLGPAMQEEVLRLVLLALEDGSALSRKVLVMFVVQRLEPHFPQASKTSIGHVVQLLYRASCFKVSKRESDSSLMQLKEEFRTYESLRREHDAQIVQIANEAGLRIAPDQWSSLLYGDTAHKSHMQSIIDKLQTPQSFAQSVQELFIAQQRNGDPAHLVVMNMHLDHLASIDASPDAVCASWTQLAETLTSLREVISGLIMFLQNQSVNREQIGDRGLEPVPMPNPISPPGRVRICRDSMTSAYCPRGSNCTYRHPGDQQEWYQNGQGNGNHVSMNGQINGNHVPMNVSMNGNHVQMNGNHVQMNSNHVQMNGHHVQLNRNHVQMNGNHVPMNGNHVQMNGNHLSMNGNLTYAAVVGGMHHPPPSVPNYMHRYQPIPQPIPQQQHMENYGIPGMQQMAGAGVGHNNIQHNHGEGIPMPQPRNYQNPMLGNDLLMMARMPMQMNNQLNYDADDESPRQYGMQAHQPMYPPYMANPFPPGLPVPPGLELARYFPLYLNNHDNEYSPNGNPNQCPEPVWPPMNNNIFSFEALAGSLNLIENNHDPMYYVLPGSSQRTFGTLEEAIEDQDAEEELEQELKNLERRIDTEFKNTD